MKIWNQIQRFGSACVRVVKSGAGRVAAAAAAVLGVGSLLTNTVRAAFTDPAADINTAVAGAASGASTAYTSVLTILASIVIVGLVIWGLRKGRRPS